MITCLLLLLPFPNRVRQTRHKAAANATTATTAAEQGAETGCSLLLLPKAPGGPVRTLTALRTLAEGS